MVHPGSLSGAPRGFSLVGEVVEFFFKTVVRLDCIRMTVEEYLSVFLHIKKGERVRSLAEDSFAGRCDKVDGITWENVENERRRGMEIDEMLAGLGGLEMEYRAGEALGTHKSF